jgi:polyhydroxybutyrate depolymerase
MEKSKTIKSAIYCILTFMVLIFSQNISYAQIQSGSFRFDGIHRNYSVFLPQNYKPNMPVVMNLHGYNQSIQNLMGYTMMNDFADTTGFIVVYPVGTGRKWNSGAVDGRSLPNVDDVGFISALIDTLNAKYNIDMARIYCTGFSNGAEMTYRLAYELRHRIAAVAPVAGGLNNSANNWNPIFSMPILDINGTADPYRSWGFDWWSAEKSFNFWIQNNDCTSPAETILLPNINTGDNCTVEKISFTNCSDSISIIRYKIINGGHHWPGGNAAFHTWNGGNLNKDINANVEMWNFFKNYENPIANIARVKVFPEYYFNPQGDTLFVKAHLTNPEDHPVSVYAKINGEVVSFSDSLLLYDDGMHGDENPDDNIWGNGKLLSGLEEDIYKVETYTNDFSLGTIYKHLPLNYFTSIGPVVVDHYEITQVDTNVFELEYDLRNDGSTSVAIAVTTVVFTTDTNVTSITRTLNFRDITPGQVKSNPYHLTHKIYTQNDLSNMDFIVHIFSNGHFFWSDTLTFTVTGIAENETNQPIEYALKQNYPNPFNPSTKINFTISQKGYVTLKVYDILGNEIVTLASGEKPAGTYELTWDATNLPSGVYFYQLNAGPFVETKKMLLVK